MRIARSSSRRGGGLPRCMPGSHTPQVWAWPDPSTPPPQKPARHAGIPPAPPTLWTEWQTRVKTQPSQTSFEGDNNWTSWSSYQCVAGSTPQTVVPVGKVWARHCIATSITCRVNGCVAPRWEMCRLSEFTQGWVEFSRKEFKSVNRLWYTFVWYWPYLNK